MLFVLQKVPYLKSTFFIFWKAYIWLWPKLTPSPLAYDLYASENVGNYERPLTYSKFTLLSNLPSITCHISNTRQDILIAHDVYVILLSLQLFYNGLSFLYLSFQYFVISAISQLNKFWIIHSRLSYHFNLYQICWMFIFILSNETFHENSQNVCASVQSKTWGPHYPLVPFSMG